MMTNVTTKTLLRAAPAASAIDDLSGD